MSETYEFFETTPVPREGRRGAGRRPDPNPFIDGVRAIAGQAGAGGNPLARGADVRLDVDRNESYKTRYSRIRRQLTAAGKIVGAERGTGRVQIDMALKPAGDAYRLTFWDRYAGR